MSPAPSKAVVLAWRAADGACSSRNSPTGGLLGPDISAAHAPAGDISTAIMDIDSTLRRIHAAGGVDSPGVVTRLREMPRHVVPSTIPTMAAMMTAAAMPASPTLLGGLSPRQLPPSSDGPSAAAHYRQRSHCAQARARPGVPATSRPSPAGVRHIPGPAARVPD